MNNNEEKCEFLSSVSHEIRTVLNTVVGLSEDIGGYENIPEEIQEDAEDLITSSKTLFELIDNVIDYIMLDNNAIKIVESPYQPKELFEELEKLDEGYIEDKPVYLHTNIDPNLPYELVGDKKHVQKIANNLLTNAIKYTDGGDIWFNVTSVNENDVCKLIISVKDTGRGMKPEEVDKLFTKIERVNIKRDTSTEGTGLGLAITKHLLDMMGGSITVESKYEEGSTFTVTIPQKIKLVEEPDLSRTQRLKLESINFEEEGYGYKKILVVDDNQLNIKVVRRILEQYDLIIEECYNGQECIDIVSEDNDYDLILMDIMMPGLSGEETLHKLNEIEGFDTPVIALTADAEAGSEDKYEKEGFADYIAKPFSKVQIEEKLNKVLKQREVNQEENDWY